MRGGWGVSPGLVTEAANVATKPFICKRIPVPEKSNCGQKKKKPAMLNLIFESCFLGIRVWD